MSLVEPQNTKRRFFKSEVIFRKMIEIKINRWKLCKYIGKMIDSLGSGMFRHTCLHWPFQLITLWSVFNFKMIIMLQSISCPPLPVVGSHIHGLNMMAGATQPDVKSQKRRGKHIRYWRQGSFSPETHQEETKMALPSFYNLCISLFFPLAPCSIATKPRPEEKWLSGLTEGLMLDNKNAPELPFPLRMMIKTSHF